MANPIVTFTMADGKVMKAELYPEVAPNTVNNFISLVNKGFYNGLIFHRRSSVYGTFHDAELRRKPVLYHAQGCSAS